MEKGAFPLFDRDAYLNHPYVQQRLIRMQTATGAAWSAHCTLTSIAPTGTISL